MKKILALFFVIAVCLSLFSCGNAEKDDGNETGGLLGGASPYSDSRLVSYTKLSPNIVGKRTEKIDTVCIHCANVQYSVERFGEVYAVPGKGSVHYAVGEDGRIALLTQEKNLPDTFPSDGGMLSIVVASDSSAPYAVSAKAYKSLITLLADICRRNGIEELRWSEDKTERVGHTDGACIVLHSDYADHHCPGQYLTERMPDIAAQVNALLAD